MLNRKMRGTQGVQLNGWLLRVAAALGLLLAAGAQAAPGQAETTFGTGGRVGLLFPAEVSSYADGMLIQPDGKIVVAAACGVSTQVLCVSRHLSSGVADPGFNAVGAVITTDDITNASVIKIVLQRDGKLVIASKCSNCFCAIRLNGDGSRDSNFGANGKIAITARTAASNTYAFTEQHDGKLLFAGRCTPAANEPQSATVCAARIHANGSLDTSFGINGVALIEAAQEVEVNSMFLAAINEQADGKLALSGQCTLLARPPLPQAKVPCVFRLQGNGAPDASYGINGFASVRISADNYFSAAAAVMQPDEAVLIGGICDQTNFMPCIVRFDRDGVADATLQRHAVPEQYDFVLQSLHLQRDGKLLATGTCRPDRVGPYLGCFLRYQSDGSLDTGVPVVVENMVPTATGRAIAAQADGKIIVASNYYVGGIQKSSLHRFEGGPFAATQCSLDIDGDGIFNPAIDGLLLTRATLGFTGPAVYAGISFPSNALRTQWGNGGDDDIRKFLVAQCGMRLNI